jgi:hypothetical protein
VHPYSDNPTSVQAAAIWTFRIDFILSFPFRAGISRLSAPTVTFGPRCNWAQDFQLKITELRSLETKKGNLVRYVSTVTVSVLYPNSVAGVFQRRNILTPAVEIPGHVHLLGFRSLKCEDNFPSSNAGNRSETG